MSSPPEGQVAVVSPNQIQMVWILEAVWIAVRRGQAGHNARALPN
jgi:hypothetical protein